MKEYTYEFKIDLDHVKDCVAALRPGSGPMPDLSDNTVDAALHSVTAPLKGFVEWSRIHNTAFVAMILPAHPMGWRSFSIDIAAALAATLMGRPDVAYTAIETMHAAIASPEAPE